MTTGEMRGDYSFRIKKQYILSLPPARRDEKAAGSWEAPRSGGGLFSLLVSLCDLCELERGAQATNGRETMLFEPPPRSHPTIKATNGRQIRSFAFRLPPDSHGAPRADLAEGALDHGCVAV